VSALSRWLSREPEAKPCPEKPAPSLPAFCNRCGKPLVRQTDANGFDEQTGRPIYVNWLHCPKYKGSRLSDPGTPNGAGAREVTADWSGFKPDWYWGLGGVAYINCQKHKPVPTEADS
jgi:hypothetical protein